MFLNLAYLVIFASKANICFKLNIKFPRGNYQPIYSSSTETLYCSIGIEVESVVFCKILAKIPSNNDF